MRHIKSSLNKEIYSNTDLPQKRKISNKMPEIIPRKAGKRRMKKLSEQKEGNNKDQWKNK